MKTYEQTHKKARLLILIIVLTMVISVIISLPVHADEDSRRVYITISSDSTFLSGNDPKATVLARVPIDLTYEDLADYGLSQYYRREAKSFDEGGGYVEGSGVVEEPTALHLFLKAVATYYHVDPESKTFVPGNGFTCEGSATHLFITKFFDHGYNFMYYINHEFPLQSEGNGATCDYCILDTGDEVDVAMFTSMDFNKKGAFTFFGNSEVEIKAGDEYEGSLLYTSTSEPKEGETAEGALPMPGETITVSSDYGKTWANTESMTDDDGVFSLEFDKPGVYYISAGPNFKYEERVGSQDKCVAPPISVIKVAPEKVVGLNADPNGNKVDLSWDEVSGSDGYFVEYNKVGESDKTVAITDENQLKIEELDYNSEYVFNVCAYVDDDYVPYGADKTMLKGQRSENAKVEIGENPGIEAERKARLAALASIDAAKEAKEPCKAMSDAYGELRDSYAAALSDARESKGVAEQASVNPDQAAIRAAETYLKYAESVKALADSLQESAEGYYAAAKGFDDKAELALANADAWIEAAAKVSDSAKQDAIKAKGEAEQLAEESEKSLRSAESAKSYSKEASENAVAMYSEAEEMLEHARKVKAEADAKKSQEEKAEDDLNDAKTLYEEYKRIAYDLESYNDKVTALKESYSSEKGRAVLSLELATSAVKTPGEKAVNATLLAKDQADSAYAEFQRLCDSLTELKTNAWWGSEPQTYEYLLQSIELAEASCALVSDKKKQEAESIKVLASDLKTKIDVISSSVSEFESYVSEQEAEVTHLVEQSDKLWQQAVKDKQEKDEEERKATEAKAALAAKIKKAKAQKVRGLKVKAQKKRKAKITWKKNTQVTGYQIFRAVKKKGKYKKIATLKKGRTKFISRKLKAKKKYFYKMRTYTKINGKTYYGKWTAVKKIKAKK